MRRLCSSSLALLLAACAPLPAERPDAPPPSATRLPADPPNSTQSSLERAARDPRAIVPYSARPKSGQDGHPEQRFDASSVPDAVPEHEPRSRYGNPPFYEVFGKRYFVMKDKDAKGFKQRGIASWYGTKFHGARTSSGERYDMYAMTAAHKELPLPTWVRVTNLENKRSVVVKVNDRGPFHDNRIIDLSYSAAQKLDILGKGTGLVEIRVLEPGASRGSTGVPGDASTPRITGAGAAPDPAVVTAAAPESDVAPAEALAPPEMYLQVGAFAEERNARALALSLEQAGLAVRAIVHNDETGKVLHKLRIGPLSTVDEVDVVTRKLQDMGLSNPKLVIP
jgi:rare lipoprotein A